MLLLFLFSGLLLIPTSYSPSQDEIPKTVQEAVAELQQMIPNNELAIIRRTSEEEFITNARFTLGVWMQDAWELWEEHSLTVFFNDNGFYVPDEMTEIILMCYWRLINQNSFDIDEVFEIKREEIRKMRSDDQ